MASQRQINANRRNSLSSTGPTSPAGKVASSQNAFKTGIDAQSQVLRFENAADLDVLTAEYYLRFAPTSPEERCLVDILINSEWLRRRYMNVEARVWETKIDQETSIGGAFSEEPQTFSRLQSRLDSAQRGFANALKQLIALRANRPANPEPVEPSPLRLRQPKTTQQPFDMKSFNAKLASFLDLPYPDAPQTSGDAPETLQPESDEDQDLPSAA